MALDSDSVALYSASVALYNDCVNGRIQCFSDITQFFQEARGPIVFEWPYIVLTSLSVAL